MNGVSRFLSRREKKGKGTAAEGKPHHHHHHVSKELSRILHSEEKEKRKPDKDEDKKVKELLQRLQAYTPPPAISQPQIEDILRLPSVNGNVDKALELVLIVEDAVQGTIQLYAPDTKLVGAVNRENVTCYLDSLLFSMFARTDSFEGILTADFQDTPRKKLATLLRLWVNMLRTGKLITTDITERLQESLKDCGWPEAALLRQQDVSEAFTFITGKLDLPLLTLKMDVYHTGKEDKDDHRIVRERLLDVAIPKPPEDGSAIRLEDCLESYFNNKIEVKRHLQRRNTVQSFRSIDKGQVLQVETLELRPGSPSSLSANSFAESPHGVSPINMSPRADSIFSHRRIQTGEPSEMKTHDDISIRNGSLRRASTIRREVLMPAWQFFSLIPWYTHDHPRNDEQVAVHLQTKRPVLGICLKRYSMTNAGVGSRLDTFIDIPLEIGLPHFISDDCGHGEEGYEPNFTNFKLSLLSVICHRGKSLDAGHYISLVRGEAPNETSSTPVQSTNSLPHSQHSQPPQPPQSTNTAQPSHPPLSTDSTQPVQPDQPQEPALDANRKPEAPWLRFDDLAKERITYVDIHQALKDECPYLLFYQVRPIDDEESLQSERGDPPSYHEATTDQSTTQSTSELSKVATESVVTDTSTTTTTTTTSSVIPTDTSKESLVPAVERKHVGTAGGTDESVVTIEPVRTSTSDSALPLPTPEAVVAEQPTADPLLHVLRPNSIDLSTLSLPAIKAVMNPPRTSIDDPRGRGSFQSNRRSSITFTDSINGSYKGGSSAPITPGDETETKTGFLSASRRNSIGKGWLKAKSRPTSQSGENRLSLSMSRLRSAISKDRLGTAPPLPMENGVIDYGLEGAPGRNPSVSGAMNLEMPGFGHEKHRKSGSIGRSKSLRHPHGGHKSDKEKRSRSLGRKLDGESDDNRHGKSKGKKEKVAPDRECVVM